MKKINLTLLACLLFALLPTNAQKIEDAYDYSDFKVKAKTWKPLTSYEEKLNDCQIPNILLTSMSTEGMVETCLTFPFYIDIFAFDDIQDGFQKITSRFNGFEELYKRKDAGTIILNRYKSIQPDAFNNTWTNIQKGQFGWKITYIEMLLAQKEIITMLNKNERIDLLDNSLSYLKKKMDQRELYGIDALEMTVLVMGRVLMVEEFAELNTKISNNLNLKSFIEEGVTNETNSLDEIINITKQYISINQ